LLAASGSTIKKADVLRGTNPLDEEHRSWENRSTFLCWIELEQILRTGTIYRAEEYQWNGMSYLRVFIVGRRGCAWGGTRTGKALSMIDEAKEPKRGKGVYQHERSSFDMLASSLLCDRHTPKVVVARERASGLKVNDRRDWREADRSACALGLHFRVCIRDTPQTKKRGSLPSLLRKIFFRNMSARDLLLFQGGAGS
jgi:hypothetical protein